MQLFEELKVNWLLVKNSGGSQSEAKLIAARKLGISVGVLNRPKSFGGTIVSELSEVGNWLEGLGYE
jgi:precorrin-6A/cobalt-precorrin-6A reductase